VVDREDRLACSPGVLHRQGKQQFETSVKLETQEQTDRQEDHWGQCTAFCCHAAQEQPGQDDSPRTPPGE
jgi:hypothetical protein